MPISSLKYLEKISYNDANFITETVEIFIENTPKEIKKLRDETQSENLKNVGNIAHALKSSLKMMDMQNAYQLCLQIEKEAKSNGNKKVILDKIDEIDKDCLSAFKELHSELKKL